MINDWLASNFFNLLGKELKPLYLRFYTVCFKKLVLKYYCLPTMPPVYLITLLQPYVQFRPLSSYDNLLLVVLTFRGNWVFSAVGPNLQNKLFLQIRQALKFNDFCCFVLFRHCSLNYFCAGKRKIVCGFWAEFPPIKEASVSQSRDHWRKMRSQVQIDG